LADRWVDNPHIFPNCCHRCLKSGVDNGPYFHEEWDYCQPDRWPGPDPAYPRRARKFTCRSCFQFAASQPGAPLLDSSAKQLSEASERIMQLEASLAEANGRPTYVDADQLVEKISVAFKANQEAESQARRPAAKPAVKKAAK
jgi:hypothetical protein